MVLLFPRPELCILLPSRKLERVFWAMALFFANVLRLGFRIVVSVTASCKFVTIVGASVVVAVAAPNEFVGNNVATVGSLPGLESGRFKSLID